MIPRADSIVRGDRRADQTAATLLGQFQVTKANSQGQPIAELMAEIDFGVVQLGSIACCDRVARRCGDRDRRIELQQVVSCGCHVEAPIPIVDTKVTKLHGVTVFKGAGQRYVEAGLSAKIKIVRIQILRGVIGVEDQHSRRWIAAMQEQGVNVRHPSTLTPAA